ncbi:RNA polymerase II largest subunit [Phellopilus nigrolimitatus]|nr:RNA polymerase II largest subunit [Phellopilus nigrolimitatus]
MVISCATETADKLQLFCDPKGRMAAVWAYCKGKTACEADTEPEEAEGSENVDPQKKGHGGCGHLFPQYTKSKHNEDKEFRVAQPGKRLFTPAKVYNVLNKIIDIDDDLAFRNNMRVQTGCISTDGCARRGEDGLMYKLGDIIEDAPACIITGFAQLL